MLILDPQSWINAIATCADGATPEIRLAADRLLTEDEIARCFACTDLYFTEAMANDMRREVRGNAWRARGHFYFGRATPPRLNPGGPWTGGWVWLVHAPTRTAIPLVAPTVEVPSTRPWAAANLGRFTDDTP